MIEEPVLENPFEKTTVEQLNDNYGLLAYLFAKPEEAVYNKLIGRENYVIVGGLGSGKTMLLKYLALETQIEALNLNEVKNSDFVGFYIKIGRGSFKSFLRPGGEFKDGGEALFAHYFNLLILERIISVILYGKKKGVLEIKPETEAILYKKIISKFSFSKEEPNERCDRLQSSKAHLLDKLQEDVAAFRHEIETFLNVRDLERDLRPEDTLTIQPTDIKSFLDEAIRGFKDAIQDLSSKRFYVLLDECEQFSKGQQRVINTLIKQRVTTIVFKLATRPPDISTWETVDEKIGLTDREIKTLFLDEMYKPTSKGYRDLCYRVAKKRLEKYHYQNVDLRKILGDFRIENDISEESLSNYLRANYPSRERVEKKFKEVYKDFKIAATFQILGKRRVRKKYAGFITFVMLSSGIMLHFLELCRDTFAIAFARRLIVRTKEGETLLKNTPLPIEIQDKAAGEVSDTFYQDISRRAESLKESPIEMEFGGKIQYIVSVLGGIFREKLMTFNEPEAARIEVPEGISALDNSTDNPIRQIFTTAIAISVFQKGKPYMPKRVGGIRPPTYILNRILAPYCGISPRARWRTKIPASTFNKILQTKDIKFQNEVLLGKEDKGQQEEAKEASKKSQLTIPFFQISESMPILEYLTGKNEVKVLEGKTLLIVLHFLKDLIPFIDSCKRAGALPSRTFIFYKSYQYPNIQRIKEHLERDGYKVHSLTELKAVLEQLSKDSKSIVIVEDGGYIVPEIHKNFKELLQATLGAVEQTTRGIRNDQKVNDILFPVISIPGSKIKDTFEPSHVARAVVKNIQELIPNKDFSGRKALVIGYGNIGRNIALQLRDNLKMQVSIYDKDTNKQLEARQNAFDAVEIIQEAVKDKFLIVGATGETSVSATDILSMEHNVYLVSASSEQWEFCISDLNALSTKRIDLCNDSVKIGTKYEIRDTGKCINLVADGYPVNFWESESMPNEVGDLIMSLMFLSVLEIAAGSRLRPGIDDEIVNVLADRYELSKLYINYHK
jgi:S-adenosylhomocysteine hydrolase